MKKGLYSLLLVPSITVSGFACADIGDFISAGTASFELRHEYIYLVADDFGSIEYNQFGDYDMSTWATTFEAGYESPYLYDHLGFDVSVYGAVAHDYGEGFATRYILKSDNDGGATGLGKIPVYALKQKFDIGDTTFKFYEGARHLKDFGIVSSREAGEALSSYSGIMTEIANNKWNIKGAYINRYSETNEESPERMYTADGQDVDYIATADFTYKGDGQSFRYYIGESDNYQRRQMIEYAKFLEGKKLTGKFFYNEGLSNWKSMSDTYRWFDKDAWQLTLESEFFLPKAYVKFGYAYTSAERQSSLGKYNFEVANEVYGNINSFAKGESKYFTNDGEHLIGAIAFYDVSQEFSTGLIGRYGFGMKYKGNDLTESEIAWVNVYKPASMPNLEFTLIIEPHDTTFQKDITSNTPRTDENGKTYDALGQFYSAVIKYTF